MRVSLVLAAITFALVGCRSQAVEPVVPTEQQRGSPSVDTIAVTEGETVRLSPGGLGVHFARVLSDSRCPRNVTCVWAGSLRVRLTFSENAGTSATVELESGIEPRSTRFGGFEIRLLPRITPDSGEPGTYVIRLEISPV